ncbi:MAG TPA: type II toxin-antitoxin system RelE/ParE family toxin [Cellvibrio sp.]|nr:type II toxin-antitoxin system RelE/ParE family toxin [Cellvibrio sp.]
MIYKTRAFQSSFKKASIDDKDLAATCDEMTKGLIDASLGENLFKKRIAMPGQGKSGSYRTMIGALIGSKYFFLYMFATSDKANINKREELALKELAKELINLDQKTLGHLIRRGELIEVEISNE